MQIIITIQEDNHGLIGIAKNYFSAIDFLIDEDWLDGNFELYNAIKKIDQLNNEILNLKNENKKLIKKNKALSNEIQKFKSRKIVRFADKIKKI